MFSTQAMIRMISGRAAVAERAAGNWKAVEQDRRADTPKDYNKVALRVVDDLRRRVQQGKEGAGKGNAQHGEKHCHPRAQQDARGKALSHALHIPCAKTLGNHDGKAAGEALGKPDDKKHDAAGTAYGPPAR